MKNKTDSQSLYKLVQHLDKQGGGSVRGKAHSELDSLAS